MSDRSTWKMLHLLYTLRPGWEGLSDQELANAGIDCGPDTIEPLRASGVVSYNAGRYALTEASRRVLGACVVANRRWSSDDMWVDAPSAFVVMPFGEPWSKAVFADLIEPAVTEAGLKCLRGDTIARVGDLTQNIWGALLHAGIVIADVSVLNANVFYELGLTHALGKDTIVLKQAGSKVPADILGAHYHEYDLQSLEAGKEVVEIRTWAVGPDRTESSRKGPTGRLVANNSGAGKDPPAMSCSRAWTSRREERFRSFAS